MLAMIQAVNEDNDVGDIFEEGKRTRFESKNFRVTPAGDCVVIKGSCEEELNDGSRGGAPTTMIRRIVLNLGVDDLIKIFNEAVEGYVLAVDSCGKIVAGKQPELPSWYLDMYRKK